MTYCDQLFLPWLRFPLDLPTWQLALEGLSAVYPAVPLQHGHVRRFESALLAGVLLRRRVDHHVRGQGVLPLEAV